MTYERMESLIDFQNKPRNIDARQLNTSHVHSVFFDSLAPARLAPPGPTCGCSNSRQPWRSVVVNNKKNFGNNPEK